tara:strand:+ start:1325 stop:1978 length:654 start_codon:yes stop_codon:yes gene_type:complete
MKITDIYGYLFEQEEQNQKQAPEKNLTTKATSDKVKASDDSVDDQIDALILKYENASIAERPDSGPMSLSESLSKKKLGYLFEQEEDEAMEDEGGDAAAEEGGDEADPAGSEDMKVSEPADSDKLPNLDVDAFSTRAARLIMNYRNLLNVEEAILNRFKNFLDENYGDVYVNKFLESLENDHGIGSEMYPSVSYAEDDDFAIGANPAGSGITGGGGG